MKGCGCFHMVTNFALVCSVQDLSVIAQVNSTFRALSSDEGLWRSL
jgi:hypothetical protein